MTTSYGYYTRIGLLRLDATGNAWAAKVNDVALAEYQTAEDAARALSEGRGLHPMIKDLFVRELQVPSDLSAWSPNMVSGARARPSSGRS